MCKEFWKQNSSSSVWVFVGLLFPFNKYRDYVLPKQLWSLELYTYALWRTLTTPKSLWPSSSHPKKISPNCYAYDFWTHCLYKHCSSTQTLPKMDHFSAQNQRDYQKSFQNSIRVDATKLITINSKVRFSFFITLLQLLRSCLLPYSDSVERIRVFCNGNWAPQRKISPVLWIYQ